MRKAFLLSPLLILAGCLFVQSHQSTRGRFFVCTSPRLQAMAGLSGNVCTLILSKSGVKLGLVHGSELADPNGLLEGSGKVHRNIHALVDD